MSRCGFFLGGPSSSLDDLVDEDLDDPDDEELDDDDDEELEEDDAFEDDDDDDEDEGEALGAGEEDESDGSRGLFLERVGAFMISVLCASCS